MEGKGLDKIEVLIDFLEVKAKVAAILKEIDYTYLNENLNLNGRNPSAEVVAHWLFHKIQQAIRYPAVCLRKVTVWETEDCAASYFEA